jgi:hypothetical protein
VSGRTQNATPTSTATRPSNVARIMLACFRRGIAGVSPATLESMGRYYQDLALTSGGWRLVAPVRGTLTRDSMAFVRARLLSLMFPLRPGDKSFAPASFSRPNLFVAAQLTTLSTRYTKPQSFFANPLKIHGMTFSARYKIAPF